MNFNNFFKGKLRNKIGFLLFLVFIFSDVHLLKAHLSRSSVCHAYSLTKTIVIIEPYRKFKNLDEFIKVMSKDKVFSVPYTRCIAQAVDRFKYVKTGFRLESGVDEFGKFILKIIAPLFNVIKQPISLTDQYNSVNSFSDILAEKSKKETRYSKHTVLYRNFLGNILLMPRKGYISFYDFSKKASAVEIMDIWKQASIIFQELHKQKRLFIFTTYAGSASGQTVPHFHFLFKIKK